MPQTTAANENGSGLVSFVLGVSGNDRGTNKNGRGNKQGRVSDNGGDRTDQLFDGATSRARASFDLVDAA
jgi:hypothetical protein